MKKSQIRPRPTAPTYRAVHAAIPGSGKQAPTTDAIEFDGATVIGATGRALHIELPLSKVPDAWIARSQLCEGANIHRASTVGDHGTVRIPIYIVRKWRAAIRDGWAGER